MKPQRLSILDAGFLEAEDADQHANLAIGAVAVVEGPPPDADALMLTINERVQRIPRCTQVLRSHPWDIAAPDWVHDDGFDIRRHVRRTAVTPPGGDAALFSTVAELMERRLDRARPLWECWLIDGLDDGRWALLIKVHHSVADGIAASSMMAMLFDDDAADAIGDTPQSEVPQRDSRFRLPSLNPVTLLQSTWSASVDTARAAVEIASGATEIAAGILFPADRDMTGPLSDLRRFSAASVALPDIRMICRRFDVTINDVALAAIADSFREAMLRHNQSIRPNSLRTLVPVSVRKPDELHIPDNRVSVMLPLLPVDQADTLQRLRTVHRRLTKSKSGGQSRAGSVAVRATNYLPFALTAWMIRLITRMPQHGVVTVATNVPGPPHQVKVMGHTVRTLMPIPPIAVQLRLGIAITSYRDELTFGVLGDFDSVVGADEIARGIEDGVNRLVAVTRACKKSRRVRSQLLLLSS